MFNLFLFITCFSISLSSISCNRKINQIKQINPTKYGDVYITTLLGDASYLNPLLATDSASGEINSLIFNGLVKYDKNIKLIGDLAESFKISKNGLEIIFKLRKNIKWHDGYPFTSEDVKFTYEKLIDPNVKTPYSSDYLLVKKFVLIDKYTIKIIYKKPFAPSLESWSIGIIPKHIFQPTENRNSWKGDFNSHPANRNPIGTGPYKFVEWKTDEKIVLTVNPEYFEGRPYINKVIYRIIPDQSVQFLELRNQSIDSMGLTPDQYRAYEKFFVQYNKFRYPSFSYTYIGFNFKNKLFKDRKVRLAIALALNKQEIIDGVLLGMGKSATGPFVPQSWAYNPEVKDYKYLPDESKKILSELGWKDTDSDGYLDKDNKKFEFTLMTNQGNKLRELTAQIVQRQLQKIGIKVNIRIVEWSSFIHNFVDKKLFDAVILGWALSRDPDQYSIWHSKQTGYGQYNFISYENKQVDKLLEMGRVTFDIDKRKKIYRKLHSIIFNDIPYIFLYYPESLPVIHKRFIGPEIAPLGLGWNFIKWYVEPQNQKYKF